MTEQDNLQILEEFVRCIHENDVEAMKNLLHDDYVEEYPQSGERIRGKQNTEQVYENFENLPDVKGYNCECCGDLGILEMALDYPDGGIYNACEIVHFRDGKIANVTAYFGQPFEAPDWRSQWVERMGETTEETYEQRPSPRL